jgi:hypothetical protein
MILPYFKNALANNKAGDVVVNSGVKPTTFKFPTTFNTASGICSKLKRFYIRTKHFCCKKRGMLLVA